MQHTDRIPNWVWQGALGLLIGAVVITLVLLVATLAGVADPRPLGVLTIDDHFADMSRWQLTPDGEYSAPPSSGDLLELPVSAGGGELVGRFDAKMACPCTLELRAKQLSGAHDARYGLWWGDAAGRTVVLAGMNSDGYMGIEQKASTSSAMIMDWQLFPHVRPAGESNDFRADIDAQQVTVRLNEEAAAQFPWKHSGAVSAGFFIQASRQNKVLIGILGFKTWETKATNQ